jgi:hypothetical protein
MKSLDSKKDLFEGTDTNLAGKMLLASLGAWLVGKSVNTKVRGNVNEVTAISNALLASKSLQEELRSPGATVESVTVKLRAKQASATEFERVIGVPWPL